MEVAPRTPAARTLPASAVISVFVGAIVAMILIGAADVFLVRVAHERKIAQSRWLFARAEQFGKEGRHPDALELFRAAYNQQPGNPEYHLAFIRALKDTGRLRQAQASLEALLHREPANGPANVEMARILVQNGRWEEAAWYYHRGLYGQWPPSSNPDLTEIRLELANLLAQQGARQELLAELVLLNVDLERRPELASRYGELLLAAQNWSEARKTYLALIQSNPKNPEFWVGLARAQFGINDYAGSRRSLSRAAALAPDNSQIQHELETVTRILTLDPGQRRLGPAERHRRSHELVSALLAALEACTPDSAELMTARQQVEKHQQLRNARDAANEDLDLVEQFWNSRDQICTTGVSLSPAVELTIEHVLR
jgi:tetratricopeptide (TPR) repeat protein